MRIIISIFLFLSLTSSIVEAQESILRLTFNDALKRSQTLSTSVLVADARVQAAIARMSYAQSSLLPHINGVLTGARQTKDMRSTGIELPVTDPHIGPYNSLDARARMTQTIVDLSAQDRLRAASIGRNLSGLQLQKTKQDALALVAMMYIQAQRAQQQVILTRAFLKRDKKTLDIAKTALNLGTTSLLEFRRAKADYAQGFYLYQTAKAFAQEQRMDLAAALKIPLDAEIIFIEDKYSKILNIIQEENKLLDVSVAKEQVHLGQLQLKSMRAEYFPKVSLFGDYGRSGQSFDNGSNVYTLGLQATIPFWEIYSG